MCHGHSPTRALSSQSDAAAGWRAIVARLPNVQAELESVLPTVEDEDTRSHLLALGAMVHGVQQAAAKSGDETAACATATARLEKYEKERGKTTPNYLKNAGKVASERRKSFQIGEAGASAGNGTKRAGEAGNSTKRAGEAGNGTKRGASPDSARRKSPGTNRSSNPLSGNGKGSPTKRPGSASSRGPSPSAAAKNGPRT